MKFEFHQVGRVIVERGGVRRLGELARVYGSHALLVHNADAVVDLVQHNLRAAGLACDIYRQRGEPSVTSVQQAIEHGRSCGADVVIGLGGGSAIDCAKAAAAILANSGEPLDYMEVVGRGQKITKTPLPWIAVPTTAGTGAEATRNAVVSYPEKHYKASIRCEMMLPKIALLDVELAVSVSREVTAAAGADALCQLIESYTSSNANPLSDALALEGMMRAAKSLKRACDVPDDLDAREDMALAALMSGITLTNAGLGAVHGLAAPLGGSFAVPHGVVCAALLPHVMRANVKALRERQPESPALSRYAIIGPAMTGGAYASVESAIDAGIEFVHDLASDLRIPPLRNYGVEAEHVPGIVSLARQSSSIRYNPIELTEAELGNVLRAAI